MICTGALDGSGWLCCPTSPRPAKCPIQSGSLCMFDSQCNKVKGCEKWACNVPGSEGRHFCGPPKVAASQPAKCPIQSGSLCMFDSQCNTVKGCENWACSVPGSEGRHFCGPPKAPVCPMKRGSLCMFDTQCN